MGYVLTSPTSKRTHFLRPADGRRMRLGRRTDRTLLKIRRHCAARTTHRLFHQQRIRGGRRQLRANDIRHNNCVQLSLHREVSAFQLARTRMCNMLCVRHLQHHSINSRQQPQASTQRDTALFGTIAAMPRTLLAVVKFKKASKKEPAQAKQLDPDGNLRHFANLNARFKQPADRRRTRNECRSTTKANVKSHVTVSLYL